MIERLSASQSTSRWFSAVHDPFPHLKTWLEALAAGAPAARFKVDEEHIECTFDARQASAFPDPGHAAPMRFELRQDALVGGDEIVLDITLERAALVRLMYECVREFVASGRYVPIEWEHPPADDEAPFGGGHGGTRLREWRSEAVERWLAPAL